MSEALFPFAADRGDESALSDGTRTRTWPELEDCARRTASLLGALGVEAHDHVAVLAHNRVELVELLLGAYVAGVWLTPINWHLTVEECAYIVRDSGARVVFCDDDNRARAEAAAGEARVVSLDELVHQRAALAGCDSFAGPSGGTMIYTSGTTGHPKGVKRRRLPSASDAFAAMRGAGALIGLNGRGPHLITGPMYHAAPLLLAVYDMMSGAPLHIMPRWDEATALRLIDALSVRHTHLVPTMMVRLLRLPEAVRSSFAGSSLELVLHGAAPISPSVKRRMIDWWGPVITEYWGATEGGVYTLCNAAEWLERPGTVGRPLPHFEVYARGDDGQRLPAGETGALYCRHALLPGVFEYHGDEAKTRGAHPEPHLFTAGDIGWVDDDGYVFLSDRKSHMIISGGVNIYPAEIEHVIAEHPAVADVAVFGIPDDEWGETVKAAVELRPGYEPSPQLEADILSAAREHLAGYKVPRSVDFEPELPRYSTGKLYVRRLREKYWQGRDRKI